MNHGQLAQAIAKEFFLSEPEAAVIIDSILAKITGSLRKDERVYFRNFGSFVKVIHPGHKVRHPKTGQMIWIPPRPDVNFNPAKGLLKTPRAIKKPVRRKPNER